MLMRKEGPECLGWNCGGRPQCLALLGMGLGKKSNYLKSLLRGAFQVLSLQA